MATSKTSNKISTPSGQKSTKEVKEQLLKQDQRNEIFAQAKNALKLLDLTKTESRTFTVYNKDLLRQYLKNPKSYESQLRDLSRFLYRYCYPYRRLCWYNAHMIDLKAASIIPRVDFTKEINEEKVLKTYYQTITETHRINLETEIFKCALVAWREDTVYGYIYDDKTDGGFFAHVLDGKYCKVSSMEDGILRYAFDFSYFRSHSSDLEYWDSEWQTKYNAYLKDTSLRWQELDPERQICFKVNIDDMTMDFPPYASLFESMIDLIDLQSIQSVKDELSIYKLLVARLQVLSGTKEPDDFEVDIDSAIEYYNNLVNTLPDQVAAILSPLPIEAIEFKGTDTSDTDSISNAIKNLFKNTGSSQVLDSEKSGSTIFNAQILCDTQMALSSILPQIERWMNKYLDYSIGEDHSFVRYLMVSPYTKDAKKESLLKSGQNGVPVKLVVSALDGFDPYETLGLDLLENKLLKLHENWIPFSTSYTESADDGGAPEKDVTELTDEGDSTREQDKNDM